jgi:hypothetical protein
MYYDASVIHAAILKANELGMDRKRVVDFQYLPSDSATGTDSFLLVVDDGPRDATEA